MIREPVHFYKSATTRRLFVLGLVLGWVIGAASIVVGVYFQIANQNAVELSDLAREIIPLGINAVVTLLNESIGFIHTISLRWALQREGRLNFNSNLRLFTSARTSKPNKWYSNLFMLFCVVVSYAAPALLLLA